MKWIARQLYYIDFTVSSLMRRKWKNLSLVLVYSLVIFMIASVLFFGDAIRKEAAAVLSNAPQMTVQSTIAGRHDLIPVKYGEAIEDIRGVQTVRARLWGYYYHPAAGATYTVMAPPEPLCGDTEAVVGGAVLRTWSTIDGNRLFFKAHDGAAIVLSVTDTIDSDSELVSADLILVTENTFRRLFGVSEGFATDLAVWIRNPLEEATIADKIVTLFPDTRPILKREIERTYASLFDWRSGYILVLLSGAFLAFVIFAWDKATGLSAEEKGEIGILKALGWDTSDILLLKFWEGAVICLTAYLLGVAGAYVHVFVAAAPLFEHALKGWSVLYPAFRLHPEISGYQLGVVFALAVLPYTLITILPAWRVSVTDPDQVMRQ